MRAIFGASKKPLIILPIYGLASFCFGVLFLCANFAHSASKPKASVAANAPAAHDHDASSYLSPVSEKVKDFYKSLGMAQGILSWVEARTEEFCKNAPMPQKNLEPLRQGLGFTGKTGLKPAVRVIQQETLLSLKDLSEIPSQEQGINTLAAGTKRLGWAMGQAEKLRERARVLANEADAGLIGLRDALLKLDERAKAQRAENYRRQLVPGLGVIAKSLEGGLKRPASSSLGGGRSWAKPLVALAASEPKEECPAYTPRSVYDECQKRFNEGEKECDRAPDLIAAHKCTDRWLDWLIDVCPGELTKKLCKLVCPEDQELKVGRCEPKTPVVDEKTRQKQQGDGLRSIREKRDEQFALVGNQINPKLKSLGMKELDVREMDNAVRILNDAIKAKDQSCANQSASAACKKWKTEGPKLKQQRVSLQASTDSIAAFQKKIKDNKPAAPAQKLTPADSRMNDLGVESIKFHEEFHSKIYLDNGVPTIGYGHHLLAGEKEKYKNGIDEKYRAPQKLDHSLSW